MNDERGLPSAEDLDAVCAEQEMAERGEKITEEWLKAMGFRWHELERQNTKQWLLWLGDVTGQGEMFKSYEDLGVEVSANWRYENGKQHHIEDWFCWLRADYAGRYSRFIHIRNFKTRGELISLCEGVTGQDWDPANHFSGCMLRPEQAMRRREHDKRLEERLDRQILRGRPWNEIEKDDSRGRALPEHMQGAIELGKAK